MSNSFSEAMIDEIREHNDIVDLISQFVDLKKRGKNFVGLCPFHPEKTPSFTVNPEAQMFYCFGCGVGGNVFNFLMKYHGLTFYEAVKTLAEKAGIQIQTEKSFIPAKKELRKRDSLYRINDLTAKYYHAVLKSRKLGVPGQFYIKKRGYTDATVKKFVLGYAPGEWDSLCSFLLKKGFTEQEIIEAGVGLKSRLGRLIDRFRNRIMFPIGDYRGRIIGFGGRVLDGGEEPKYLNSPETALFHKGKVLYGLHAAIPEIRKNDFVLVFEGYTDVLTAQQNGIGNAVASLGTAFTEDHGRLLRRYTKNVVIAYDADTAGMAATLRGMEVLSQCGCRVSVVDLPEGTDPDEYIREHGGDAFLDLLKRKTLSLVEYKLHKVCKEFNTDSISGRIAAVNEMLPVLAKINSRVEQDAYINLVAKKLFISPEAIKEEILKYTKNLQKNGINYDKLEKNKYAGEKPHVPVLPKFKGPENMLMSCVIFNPEFIEIVDRELGIDSFSQPYMREILSIIKRKWNEGVKISPSALMEKVSLETSRQFLTELFFKEYLPPCDNESELLLYINSVKCLRINRLIEEKQALLAEAQKKRDNRLEKKYLMEIENLLRLREEQKKNSPIERGE
ncbi:MAG: DNA primase [Clostridia bacterium]|nr:DNA primase [Clostridia bacterium]